MAGVLPTAEWEQDPEFEAILAPMIASGASEQELKDTMASAKQYFLQRKTAVGERVDTTTQQAEQTEEAKDTEQYPPSFNTIVELIATGQGDKIKGVREIPLKINQVAPSESSLEPPKKPWE